MTAIPTPGAGDVWGSQLNAHITEQLALKAGTSHLTDAAAHSGTLARATDQRISLKDTRVGATLDGVADDTTELQTALDLTGDTTTLRGGGIFHPGGRARITATVTADRKALSFEGVGAGGAGGGGSLIAWDGAAGTAMFKIRRSWDLRLGGLRFVGKSTAKPSAAVSIRNEVGDASVNTKLSLHDLWIGHASGFDTDAAHQFTDGIITEGDNVQNDQSSMRDIFVTGCDGSAIKFSGSQNVLWTLDTIIANDNAIGVSCGTRHITGANWFFSTNSTTDIDMPGDSSMALRGFGSEGSTRFVRATAGVAFSAQRGYWQANPAIAVDGAMVDLSSGGLGSVVFRLSDFDFTRTSGYAGPQETIKVRTSKALIVLDNVSIPGAPATVFDLTTANAGETRHIVLRNVVDALTGTRYNGEYRWTHGDTVPDLNAGAHFIDALRVKDGTAGAPAVAFTDDPDTGMYRSALNTLNLSAGGVNQVTVANGVTTFAGDVRPGGPGQDFGTAANRWRSLYTASGGTIGFFGAAGTTQPVANPDTSGATLANLEIEVNQLKAALRSLGLIAT